jgi:hypothetical protein
VVNSTSTRARLAALSIAAAMLAVATTTAHHSILAKFDDTKPATVRGIVTLVDWTNPHVHVFVNVRDAKGQIANWAVELESPIDLKGSGWSPETLRPGDGITVQGISARNGSRQVWARTVTVTATGREVFKVTRTAPGGTPLAAPGARSSPTARRASAPRLGRAATGPTRAPRRSWRTASPWRWIPYGQLRKRAADAAKVAPMQPWALALYQTAAALSPGRSRLHQLQAARRTRQFQQPFGVQFVEDRERQRTFLLIGGGNHNYRILYMDGRGFKGQVGATTTTRCTTAAPRPSGTASHWPSRRAGSTRTSGSPTAGCRTPISCSSPSASRAWTSTR